MGGFWWQSCLWLLRCSYAFVCWGLWLLLLLLCVQLGLLQVSTCKAQSNQSTRTDSLLVWMYQQAGSVICQPTCEGPCCWLQPLCFRLEPHSYGKIIHIAASRAHCSPVNPCSQPGLLD